MKTTIFVFFLVLLFITFSSQTENGESQTETFSLVRRLSRRSRKLIRNIEHRATSRRLHGRSRATLRRLFARLNRKLRSVRKHHDRSLGAAERKKYVELLQTIANRLTMIHARLNQQKLSQTVDVKHNVVVIKKTNVDLDRLKKNYLAKMRSAIKQVSDKYKNIIQQLNKQTEGKIAQNEKFKEVLDRLQGKVTEIKSKLAQLREKYQKDRESYRKEKKEKEEIQKKIDIIQTKGKASVKKLKALVRKVRVAMDKNDKKARASLGKSKKVNREIKQKANKNKESLQVMIKKNLKQK